MIAILDYKAGNLTSVERALKSIGQECKVTDSHEEIRRADRIIFPGVGAAGKSMRDLRLLGLDGLLGERLRAGIPVLGICVGMQVLFDRSDENDTPCLGILPGVVRLFPSGLQGEHRERLKIPHMGWNTVKFTRAHPVFDGIQAESSFYFVHSYYPDPSELSNACGLTRYGIVFASAVASSNLVAVQFHPEKSGPPGLRLLVNFCAWDGREPS